ncbi:MAG: hypothetical protein JST06_06825 [Bacteroidetes bacterium]|nr:hypothetical protein [Bacteroidota bacterium]MBS1629920.1 hypothetical protein [Bacteroidota bacterium]
MKQQILFLLLSLLMLGSCRNAKPGSTIDWRVSLSHQDTKPYGASLAYQSLPDYFPNADQEILSKNFRYTGIDEHLYGREDSASLLILLGLQFRVNPEEWVSLLRFAASGNEILLLSSNLDERLGKGFQLSKLQPCNEQDALNKTEDGSSEKEVLRLWNHSKKAFGYQGRCISSFFQLRTPYAPEGDTLDEAAPSEQDLTRARMEAMIEFPGKVLGTAKGKPDFIRYTIGKGHITLHAAPLVLSNYFLLQPGNQAYLSGIWHSFPANISRVYWNEYFERSGQRSSLSVLLKYPAMRRAMLLATVALLLYVLISLKRRQRIIPVIPQIENSSVRFAETIGQLYFNKGNHANLAEKMLQHFLEQVRSKYYLDTNEINEEFARRLAAKSGRTEREASELVAKIHHLRLGEPVRAEYLYRLSQDLRKFLPNES